VSVAQTPSSHELERARLAEVIEKHQLRAVVTNSYQAVSYLAGTNILTQITLPDRLAFCVCFDKTTPALIMCSIETSMARTQTDIDDIIEYTEFVDEPSQVLADFLDKRGITSGKVGIEGRRLNSEGFKIIRKALPDVTLVAIDEEIEELQSVKTAAEIEKLRIAGQSTLDSVLAGLGTVGAGEAERTLAASIGSSMYAGGGMPVFHFFSSGPRALGAHMEPTDRRLEPGKLWRIDLGGRYYEQMNSDLARTGVVGEPTVEQEDILQNLLAIQMAGFEALEPGRPASDSFFAIKKAFEDRNMSFLMPHIGHGIGIGIHEYPILQPGNGGLLKAGMVVNIEPMFKAPERGECYHVEDLAVVTENGFELLTQPQSSLLRIAA